MASRTDDSDDPRELGVVDTVEESSEVVQTSNALGARPNAASPRGRAWARARIANRLFQADVPAETPGALPRVESEAYAIVDELAQGGLGRILRARDLRTGRIVAIKEMLSDSDAVEQRFVREALVTANLQHPCIVPVYELGRWPSGQPFYAMKLVRGEPLDAVIAEAATFDARLALIPHVVAVADALAYAHGERVIHRDLKPQNVVCGAHGETVVIDWGLARRNSLRPQGSRVSRATSRSEGEVRSTDGSAGTWNSENDDDPAIQSVGGSETTQAGAVMGTPGYMPPEQARGERVDERADL